jgi:hypothetical protein
MKVGDAGSRDWGEEGARRGAAAGEKCLHAPPQPALASLQASKEKGHDLPQALRGQSPS